MKSLVINSELVSGKIYTNPIKDKDKSGSNKFGYCILNALLKVYITTDNAIVR